MAERSTSRTSEIMNPEHCLPHFFCFLTSFKEKGLEADSIETKVRPTKHFAQFSLIHSKESDVY